MRRASYLHNSSLISLLTFAFVIGSQFHVLSTSATSTTANSHINAINSTRTSSTSATEATMSSLSATHPTSATTSAIYEIKTSTIMNSSSRGATNGSGSETSHRSTSVMPEDTASATLALKNSKSNTKSQMGFTFPKHHWTNTDSNNFGSGSSSPSTSSATTDVNRSRTFRNKHHHEHHWGPFFEEPLLNSTAAGDNVVTKAHLFTEAVLNCRVGMLKDKTVMWVRRTTEKVSLLTVGNITYSGDPRIRVKFQYPNNWRLIINPTQREDAGVYMCQVSTHPPRVFTTNLTILEPPLRLIDEQEREVGDRYYKAGSTIDLQCQVSRSFLLKEKLSILKSIQPFNQSLAKSNSFKANMANPLGAGYNELIMSTNQTFKQAQALEKQFNNLIFWAKDDGNLPASTIRRLSTTEKWLNSRVSIPDAKLPDSGNYTCSIGKLFAAIVQVQVLTGELPAAVQHNSAVTPCTPRPLWWISMTAAITVFARNISPCARFILICSAR